MFGRSRVWGLWVAIALFAVGCGGDDKTATASNSSSGGGTPSTPPSTDETNYSNGHPICTDTSDPAITSVEDEILTLTNDYRISKGLSALIDDPECRKVARAHCKHMVVHDFFAHTNPENDGPGARLSQCGVSWTAAGENIAAGYSDADAAFTGWLNSPGHLANIENAIWTHLGAGYWEDSNDGGNLTYFRYYAQVFRKD